MGADRAEQQEQTSLKRNTPEMKYPRKAKKKYTQKEIPQKTNITEKKSPLKRNVSEEKYSRNKIFQKWNTPQKKYSQREILTPKTNITEKEYPRKEIPQKSNITETKYIRKEIPTEKIYNLGSWSRMKLRREFHDSRLSPNVRKSYNVFTCEIPFVHPRIRY